MNAHVSTSAVVASSNALDNAHKAVFTLGVASAKNDTKLREAIRQGVAGIGQGGDTFKKATIDLRDAYSRGILVGAGFAKSEKDAIEYITQMKADKATRDLIAYQLYRNSHSTFSHAMTACGYVSEDKRSGNARKPGGTQSQTVKTSGKPTAAPVAAPQIAGIELPKFNKSYDARARMNAFAVELTKAMNAAPKSFDGGFQAVAIDFINALKKIETERENAAQN